MESLPPGPKAPSALQTVEWIVRPTALLRRAQARYGEPFTIRTAWSDAPLVLTSDPAEIKRVYAAPPDVLQGGEAAGFLEPFAGRNSILILHGPEHARQRKLVMPPFHGEALKRWTDTMAEVAHEELDTWPLGTPLKTLPRMRALTLEVIQRVIFGSRDPELRDALRAALDMTGSTANLIAMSLVQRDVGPYKRFLTATRRIDELVYDRIDKAGDGDAIVDLLKNSGATREELRDQLVTLLAAGHETTATALAWALERLARHPFPLTRRRPHRRLRQGGPAHPPRAEHHRPQDAPALQTRRPHPPGRRLRRALPVPRAPTAGHDLPARTVPERPTRTRSPTSRSAAATAAASAPRSPRWRCARCCERSAPGSHSDRRGPKESACDGAASPWHPRAERK